MSPTFADSSSPAKIQLGPDEIKRLRHGFEKYPEIQAVYVFGSTAAGRRHRESDLDLGVVPRADARPISKVDFLADLARLGFDRVDVVILDTDNVLLKHEVVRNNALVYQTPDFDSGSYSSRVIRQYLDFLPYLRVQRRAYKRNGFHGQA